MKTAKQNRITLQHFLNEYGTVALETAMRDYRETHPHTNSSLIDCKPALRGEAKYQKPWIDMYNEQKQKDMIGKRMIAVPDIYKIGKSKELLASVRNDFGNGRIVTGTQVIYTKNSFAGSVVHNYKSVLVDPIEIPLVKIPVYRATPVKKVVKTGLAYVRALFHTEDKASKIIDTLEEISLCGAENIRFWTPSQRSRRVAPERPVRFSYSGNLFFISGCSGCGDYGGRTRGVSLNSK
jgi:hypothetical protein